MPVRCNGRDISLREAIGEIIDLSTKNDLHSGVIERSCGLLAGHVCPARS